VNIRLVVNQLGLLVLVLSVILLGVWGLSLVWWLRGDGAEQHAHVALLMSSFVGLLAGGAAWLGSRAHASAMGRREALLLVGTSWIIGAGLSAIPYFAWAWMRFNHGDVHPFTNFVNCYFEAMSGLTTTGATVLNEIESMPRSLLLWRALTHWLGGLGIVVLFVAVLPSLGVGGKKLFRVEAPGPETEGVRPHIRETARVLWVIYLGLTVGEILLLKFAGGMSLFDSVCHTFATLATGGFSTNNQSVGGYDSRTIDLIITVFMIAAGVNFALYFALLRRRFSSVWRDTELRFYLFLVVLGTVLVSTSLMAAGEPIVLTTSETVAPTLGNALHYGLFNVVTCQSTTGFCNADFNQWPFIAKAVLVLYMFIGGCGGSTAGGNKVIRIWLMLKVLAGELERIFRPQVVRPLKVGTATLDPDLRLGVVSFVLGTVLLFALGAFLLMVLEQWLNPSAQIDFTTASTASIATLFNIGPGLGRVGAVEHYGWFTSWSKVVMSMLMALGRLEIFAILVLFSPRFWRGD
jgi:trk system potassium uptake protein TrkH